MDGTAMEAAMLTEGVSVTDESLAASARNGDRVAFTTLVERYRRQAFAVAYAMLGNREDAEDVAQEAFVRAYRALGEFDARRSWGAWLMSIVRNLCRDTARRRAVRAAHAGNERLDDAPQASPEAALLAGEGARELRQAVESMPEKTRAPLILRYAYGRSYREIAAELGLSETTVMGRLAAGLRILRRRFAGEVRP
jgi:RNA polymerase sigma-70 factor (ECF subfamily)